MGRAYKVQSPAGAVLAVEADYQYREILSAAGGHWNPVERRWELPYTQGVWQSLYLSMPSLAASDEVRRELHREESSLDRPLLPAPPMPLKPGIKPYRHQLAAYAEALHVFGAA